MPSDLQRAAQGLVDCLDQVPRTVAYLQRLAVECRQNAATVAAVSAGNPAAQQAAAQLDAAARSCEEAAHFAALAPLRARAWAEQMVGGIGGTAPGIVPLREQSGNKGAWNKELDRPAANSKYLVDNRYTFSTDDKRRVVLVEGKLTTGNKDRSEYRQRKAGGTDRRSDDDGGHLIANRFMGPSEAINLVAQLRAQNQPSALDSANWYALEQRWAEAAADDPPKTVEVSIALRYPEDSLRPSSFRVRYRIEGGDWQVQRFKN